MLVCAIENAFLYDPACGTDQIVLRVATRSLIRQGQDEEYEELYHANRVNKNTIYAITQTDFIKASLMHSLTTDIGSRRDWMADISAQSIRYEQGRLPEKDWERMKKDQAFLYLADIVSGYVAWKFRKGMDFMAAPEEIEGKLVSKAQSFALDGWDLRFFSNADRRYRSMIEAMELGELVHFYELAYDFEHRQEIRSGDARRKGPEVNIYYRNTLVKRLEEKLDVRIAEDEAYREQFINRLPEFCSVTDGYMGKRENEYEKGYFIAGKLYNLLFSEQVRGSFRSKAYFGQQAFRLSDILIRGGNHRGLVSETEQYIAVCEEYRQYVGVEEYLDHLLRMVQEYFNNMDYQKVIEIYQKNILGSFRNGQWDFSRVEKLKEALRGLCGDRRQSLLVLGKLYSTFAQALAFKGNVSAESFFRKALEEMEDDPGNADITRSYLMHFYLDQLERCGNEDPCRDEWCGKYETEAKVYFGTETEAIDIPVLKKQFETVMFLLKKNSELRFALYLYLKALRVIYSDRFGGEDAYRELIQKIEAKIREFTGTIDDLIHPWELIYINLWQILTKAGEDADYCRERLLTRNRYRKNGPTIAAIVAGFRLFVLPQEGLPVDGEQDATGTDRGILPLDRENAKLLTQISGLENCEWLGELPKEGEELSPEAQQEMEMVRKRLGEVLTYMYR
jgi:hypothetical protein